MPGVVRRPDLSTYPKANMTYSPNVFVDNLNCVRYSDRRFPSDGINIGLTVGGAEVFANDLHIQYIGHPNTRSTQIEGSCTVIIN